jgi:hypothetical protein
MSELLDKPLDITHLATYTNKIGEVASVSKMMAPVYLRDFIIGQDIATTLLARAVQADAKAKARLEYVESIAYLENAGTYLESKSIKESSEARKRYVDIDPDVVAAKDSKARTEALVVLLKGKLSELRQAHDDLKRIAYSDPHMTAYEGM